MCFWNVKIHAVGEGSRIARAGAPAPLIEAEGRGWCTLGKSLRGGDEDGASLFTAVHNGRGKNNGQKLKHGRFRLDTGEKSCFLTFPSLCNYLNMSPTSISNPMLTLLLKRKSECVSPCDGAGLMLGDASSWSHAHLAREAELRGIQGQASVPSPTRTLSTHAHGDEEKFLALFFFFKCQLQKVMI